MKLAEQFKVVPVLNYDDMDTGGNLVGDSINMKNFIRATFIINLHDIGTASPVLYLYSGATDAAVTSALTFHYAFGSAAQGTALCDVLGADATSAALTLTHGTYDDYMLIVEVDAVDMDVENSENWLTLVFTDPGTATGHVTANAILTPRYTKNLSATALA